MNQLPQNFLQKLLQSYDDCNGKEQEPQNRDDPSYLTEQVSPYEVHKLVQEYLWRQGYFNTLKAFNQSACLDNDYARDSDLRSPNRKQNFDVKNEIEIEMENEADMECPKIQRQASSQIQLTPIQRKKSSFESPNYMNFMRKQSAISLNDFELGHIYDHDQEQNDDHIDDEIQVEFDNLRASFIQISIEGLIAMALKGDITQLFEELKTSNPEVLEARDDLEPTLKAQAFIELVRKRDILEAITYSQLNLKDYWKQIFYTYDERKFITNITIDSLLGLLCYENPEQSPLGRLMAQEQRELTAHILNKALLKSRNCQDTTALEILNKQLQQVEERIEELNKFSSGKFQAQQ